MAAHGAAAQAAVARGAKVRMEIARVVGRPHQNSKK